MKAISVIVPVYMEAANIKAAAQNILWALNEARIDDYEMLIIDCKRQDGTDDGTPALADGLAGENNKIKVFHNQYINLGTKYWMGVDNARFPYVVMAAGDNELAKETLRDMLVHLGGADILISYPVNTGVRPLIRRIISSTFTFLINISVGLHMRYYNGACIHKTDMVRQIRNRDGGLTYMAELLVQLIKAGHSFKEIPVTLQKRKGGKSSVITGPNVASVGKSILGLFWKYRIRGGLLCRLK